MSRSFIVILQNGWGNMILELATGLALAKMMEEKGDSFSVVGFISSAFFSTHKTMFSKEHWRQQLPGPFDMQSIFPSMQFISSVDNNVYEHTLHTMPNLSDFSFHKNIAIHADWMSVNVQLLLSVLKTRPNLLEYMKPSSVVSQYVNEKYIGQSPQNTVTVHIRVRQPGDIMGQMKHPNPGWFVDAVNKIKPEQLNRIMIISGISTAHNDGIEYFNQVVIELSHAFPKIPITIVGNEPCYVDFFILALSPNLVITNSSFSFMAALLAANWGDAKTIIPDCLLDEFGIKMGDLTPRFECINVKDPICAFHALEKSIEPIISV